MFSLGDQYWFTCLNPIALDVLSSSSKVFLSHSQSDPSFIIHSLAFVALKRLQRCLYAVYYLEFLKLKSS